MRSEHDIPGIRCIIAVVIILHVLSLVFPMFSGTDIPDHHLCVAQAMLEIPLVLVLELLTLLSVTLYAVAMLSCRQLRTETTVGVFNGSLVLSLTAPAMFIPLAGNQAAPDNWLFSNPFKNDFFLTGDVAFHSPLPGFWLWVISLTCIGITLHLVTITRWKRLTKGSR